MMSTGNIYAQTDHAVNVHDDHLDHKPSGFLDRWLFTTNHKDIGTLYLVFSLLMFLTGGVMAMVIRAELFMPGLQLVEPVSARKFRYAETFTSRRSVPTAYCSSRRD